MKIVASCDFGRSISSGMFFETAEDMVVKLFKRAIKFLGLFIRKYSSMLLVAIMLGVSNVILEEERTLFDTRVKVEHMEVEDEDSI